jgi:DNA-binding NarL/FixJ family response regulator
MQAMIRIVIADDHQIFVDGLKALLGEEKDIQIVGEASNGQQVLAILADTPADMVLMDINMPGLDGLAATRKIHEQYPNVQVLALSMHDSSQYISDMMQAGASGYILKNTGKAELVEAIQSIHAGSPYYSPGVTATIMQSLRVSRRDDSKSTIELSKREIEVIKLIAEELTTQEIAEKLFISQHTVETHRKNLLSKLNVRNTAGLVKYALQKGLVS